MDYDSFIVNLAQRKVVVGVFFWAWWGESQHQSLVVIGYIQGLICSWLI